MKLSAAYLLVAQKLQEAADLSANDISRRLGDTISDHHRDTGKWGYYVDHFGDAESGEVIYSCMGDTMRAPYEISDSGGAAKCIIDFEGAEDVIGRMVYEPEADEPAHYAAMEEALKAEGLYAELPLYERFISKAERSAASSDDFAGKGKSFPILKPGDIMAAVRSIGRAGSGNLGPSGIKARIISIAKRKGWTKYLPKAWRGDTAQESAQPAPTVGKLALVESAAFCQEIPLQEARTQYPIKIISPGTGSTAHYPAEVLKKEAAKFKPGTLMFWNHPTPAEEAARPEGDLNNLAAITTSQARWLEGAAAPKGDGIYADAKVMADYAQRVEERAPHIGLSIRAGGIGSGRMVEGKPELKEFEYIESVDYVTKAGRGGMALAEAARDAGILNEEADMDAAELKKLQESLTAQTALNEKLLARAIKADARDEAARLLESVSLPDQAKARIIRRCTEAAIPQKDGALDVEAFGKIVEAEAKDEGAYLASMSTGARPFGMGTPAAPPIDAKEAERRREAAQAEEADAIAIFESIMGKGEAAKLAAQGRVS